MRRRRLLAAAGAVVIAAAAVTAGVLLAGPSGGALTNGGGLGYGGITVPLGLVADFPMEVENTTSMPVTLESVRLLPVPGFPVPRLVDAAVLAEHNGLITSGRGWPVWVNLSPRQTYKVLPLRGYVVLPWKTRRARHLGPLPDMIEYGVLGSRPEDRTPLIPGPACGVAHIGGEALPR